jgi:hypothetical protein
MKDQQVATLISPFPVWVCQDLGLIPAHPAVPEQRGFTAKLGCRCQNSHRQAFASARKSWRTGRVANQIDLNQTAHLGAEYSYWSGERIDQFL